MIWGPNPKRNIADFPQKKDLLVKATQHFIHVFKVV